MDKTYFIYRYVKSGKVLDVGCSGGEFLGYFSRHNFDCYGIEIGSQAAQKARRKFGNKIITQYLNNENPNIRNRKTS